MRNNWIASTLLLIVVLTAQLLAAQRPAASPLPDRTFLVVVVSRNTLEEASDIALYLRPSFPTVAVQQSRNGIFAVTLGVLPRQGARERVSAWVAAGALPSDTYLSNGVSFGEPIPLRPSGTGPKAPPLLPSGPDVMRVREECSLAERQPIRLQYAPGQTPYFACTVMVPAFTMAVVTLIRTGGQGEAHAYMVEGVEQRPDGSVGPHGVIAKSTLPDRFPNVVTLLPSSAATRRTIYIPVVDAGPASWILGFHAVDLGQHLINATGKAVGQELLDSLLRNMLGTEAAPANRPGIAPGDLMRALDLTWTAVSSDSVVSAGINVALQRVRQILLQAYPDRSFLVNASVNFVQAVMEDAYGPAFAAISR